MDYQTSIEYIESLALREQKRPSAPSLKRIEAFLSFYNNPQNTFRTFHVGGTNGKGSTVAMLDCILRQGGFKVGRFTGPHLLRYNERFHIDGTPIPDVQFAFQTTSLKSKCENFALANPLMGHLSWFEFLTALAFFYFAENNIDIAAMEVGLGGRFDATNVLSQVIATGITNIALDHEQILGNSIEAIAMEKAGIIKAGIPIITGAQSPALDIISARAQELQAPLTIIDTVENLNNSVSQIEESLALIKNELYTHGIYQYQNALIALNMLEQSSYLKLPLNGNGDIPDEKIALPAAINAIKKVFYWPGRFQIIKNEQIILDCAHNPAGTNSLRDSLNVLFPGEQFHFIFACYSDKDGLAMLRNLLRPGDNLYLVDISAKRTSFSRELLVNYAQNHNIEISAYNNMSDALAAAKKQRKKNQYIVATGSFAIVKPLIGILGWQTVEDGAD